MRRKSPALPRWRPGSCAFFECGAADCAVAKCVLRGVRAASCGPRVGVLRLPQNPSARDPG
jgi:hypothetical protein